MIDSGELIPFNDLGAASVYLQERSATTPAELTSHLAAIKGEPRSDDSGRRSPPNQSAATPWLVGRGLLFSHQPWGSGPGDLLHLASGEAKTVVDPPIRDAAEWTVPSLKPNLFPGVVGFGRGVLFHSGALAMTNRIRPPSEDLADVETSWGTMPRWKARALALSEIQSVVREALADTTTKTTRRGDALGNQTPPPDAPATLAQAFRDSVEEIRRVRDRLELHRKLDELESRIDALACQQRARQALLEAEAIFTSPEDEPDATRH